MNIQEVANMSNKNILLSVVVVTMLALSAGLAWASEETLTDASGSVVKWRQPPDMKYGVNIQSTEREPIVADDWICKDPRPVTDVHFWGSYIGWEIKNEKPQSRQPGVEIFNIRIYEDVPANVDPDIPYSHPGELLYAVKVSEFEESYVASIKQIDGYEHKYYYSLDLPEPFEQKEGTIYWISIAAVMPEEYKHPWGWETSRDHWNDNACQHWYRNDYWEELTPEKMPAWYQEHYRTVDMAFELTVKPYPDLGDAPDSTNSFSASMSAYPGVKAYFPTVYQAGAPPYGPIHRQPKALAFLGRRVSLESEADIGFDEDGINNIVPKKDTANLDKADDGVNMPLVLVHCKQNTFEYVVTVVNPLQRSIYANVWFDWNQDGDWDDTMKCPAGGLAVPAPEWAVQNQQLQLSGSGVFTFTTPRFMAWISPDAVAHDGTWMRITLSERKWDPTAGFYGDGGSGPVGGYQYGETEDYYVKYAPPNAKWVQMPDLTPNGIDIRVDNRNILADDFRCTSPSLLTDVHFWGSWKKDFKGEIANIRLSIHSDDPVGVGGTDPYNKFSKPDELLWERDFSSREFKDSLYHTVPRPGEWWWDPASKEGAIPGGDTQVWRYDIKIKPDEAFFQRGTEEKPTIYWLDISVKTENGEFGWKTRQWPDHFMDDAVWDRGSELPRWNELRYPKGHPYHELERNSIDMAFMLTFEEVPCEPSIDVEKKVLDPETGEGVDAITADVGDTVRFQFTIHNNGTCCDLTDIVVVDRLSESLEYADNAMVNGVPGEPTFVGINSVAWEFPGQVLEPCQTITIEFDAEVVECGIDENIVRVKAVCVDMGVSVTDKDTATVMAGKPELEWTWNSTTVEPD
ncbi:MAG: GEVED domain-containing protein, partial [Euryarchaeota archaeon]|nr:GEVED domain-containing protein [Euryarchaeota archaeon]